jgi:hypothetical protein
MSAPIIDYTNSAFARALGHRRGFIEQPDRALASLPPTLLRFRRKDIDETWRSLDITPHELIISEDKGRGRELRTARLVITPTRLRSALAIPPTRKTLVVSFGCGYRTRLWELNAGSLGERRFGLRLDTPEHEQGPYVWLRHRDLDEILGPLRAYEPPREREAIHIQPFRLRAH